MKKDLGKRTFTEMYMITKEDKKILDKCLKNLNQDIKKELSTPIKIAEKEIQTDHSGTEASEKTVLLDEPSENTTMTEEIQQLSGSATSSPKSQNVSNLSEDMMVYGGEIIEKQKKKGLKVKAGAPKKASNLNPELIESLNSPVSSKTRKKKKTKSVQSPTKTYTRWN